MPKNILCFLSMCCLLPFNMQGWCPRVISSPVLAKFMTISQDWNPRRPRRLPACLAAVLCNQKTICSLFSFYWRWRWRTEFFLFRSCLCVACDFLIRFCITVAVPWEREKSTAETSQRRRTDGWTCWRRRICFACSLACLLCCVEFCRWISSGWNIFFW